MSEDELSALQEQLAEARAENERLQATAADREARALHLDELNNQLREQLAAAQSDLSSVQTGLSAAQAEKDDLHVRLQAAVGKYREVLLAAAPEVVQEMVAGESIEEVDVAMERARQTVLQVRERLESQAQAGRVPTGSPPRTAPDLSALSPMEKIRLGLSQK